MTDSCVPVSFTLNGRRISCLLYADDLILLSETRDGLQKCLDKLHEYCNEWGLTVNTNKSKVMIFNKAGRKNSCQFKLGNEILDQVNEYKYLGVIFQNSGTFSKARNNLFQKSLKAFFKLCNCFRYKFPSAKTLFNIFDHTITPILLYGGEIWGTFNTKSKKLVKEPFEKMFSSLEPELINHKLCKIFLSVNKYSSTNAVLGELGRHPIYIRLIGQLVKYWHRLETIDSKHYPLLSEALRSSKYLHEKKNANVWYSSVVRIMNDTNLHEFLRKPSNSNFKCN